MKKIVGIILTVIGAATAAISLISQISVVVISGTDGSTAIHTAGKIGGASAIIGTTAVIVLFTVGIFMIVGKNKSPLIRQNNSDK